MKISVAKETRPGETRVAIVPGLVGRLLALGYDVAVEPGAGVLAGHADQDYADAGATISDSRDDTTLLVSVHPVSWAGASISLTAADTGLAFALERVPRISRAQSMDALTSQALVAGYRGAVVAAELLPRFFPLTMSSAGTLPAAEVLVLGTGVAGLEAIATCRRLGAVVKAYDVRASAAEEIRSLGAEAIDLGLPPLEGAAGYAREMSPERAAAQLELLAPYVARADALITAAAVPGHAPLLVTAAMVGQMRSGSVVVDLAADVGGNVEGVVAGEIVTIGRARVWGGQNVPAQLPGPASRLYAMNVVSLVAHLTRDGAFAPDFDDEIVSAACGRDRTTYNPGRSG